MAIAAALSPAAVLFWLAAMLRVLVATSLLNAIALAAPEAVLSGAKKLMPVLPSRL